VLDADVEVDRRHFAVRAAVSVASGERLALFGPSGAGKTTLLESIAGLVPVRRGRIVLGGRVLTSTVPPVRAVPPWQRRVGLLRQDPALFPHLSVRANLGYAPTADQGGTELAALADTLGIGGLLAAMPAALSGGQAHRVALGRLLLAHCDALLLDEPFTGLDATLRRTLTELVARLVAARQVPSLLIAHELADAQAFADRLAIIDQGRVLQDGAPDEVVLRPATQRVAELVGYRGFVPVRMPGGTGGPGRAGGPGERAGGPGERTAGPGERTAGPGDRAFGPMVVGVHPERVLAGAHSDRGIVLTGTLGASHPAGALWEAEVLIGPERVAVRLPDRPGPAGGEIVLTALEPPCFGADGRAVPGSGRPWPAQVSA
jgi:molybdate transport system ATP-binding protein